MSDSCPSLTLAGGYNIAYPRTDVILTGLHELGIHPEHRQVAWSSPFWRTRRLRSLLRKEPISTDCVFVPAFCHHEVPVVRRHTSKPVIFDPLISRYESKINDYKTAARFSIHGLSNYLADKRALRSADLVLADTEEHKRFFCERYRIAPEKIEVVYVGYNADDFYPEQPPRTLSDTTRTVGFYGSFIPLHGVDTILAAARLLRCRRDIHFELIGSGHTFTQARDFVRSENLTQVKMPGKLPYSELPHKLRSWDLCLGIFGESRKTRMVIPNKVFHYAACARPFISRDSPAMREVFTHGKDAWLCDSDPRKLARAIEYLLENDSLQRTLAHRGEQTVRQFAHSRIGKRFQSILCDRGRVRLR